MTPQEAMQRLTAKLRRFRDDPLGFVLWAYPWGVAGTILAKESGPDQWQREQLAAIGAELKANPYRPVKRGIASGNGVGKSAMVPWLNHWVMLTTTRAKGIVTANTDTQLKTKTWAEMAKWTGLLFQAHPMLATSFELTATRFHKRGAEMEWKIDAVPNNKANPAATAGLHNAHRTILIQYDEASEIPDEIWDAQEGAMTDAETRIIWMAYGNPTLATGRFKELFTGRFRDRWETKHIDSRTVARTNKEEIAEWIKAWGVDSDWVRTHVTGQFPRLGMMQLIDSEVVAEARKRAPGYIASDPLVVGIDVAREGGDASVLVARRGRDAKTYPVQRWRGVRTMDLAGEIALWCEQHEPDAVFIDVGSFGVGVFDRLIQLRVPRVFPVDFGGAGREVSWNGARVRCANMRAAMWCAMKEWLYLGSIWDSQELEDDLTGVKYGWAEGDQAILLEKKSAMKARGLASPDLADALCLTWAWPVKPRAVAGSLIQRGAVDLPDYDIHAELR